ncbi:heme ABC exporter ATP-binding protein CcmA [Streptomyces sp. ISL-43]|uniref:heme ABC exporter ATP-binding protein CcmA n=1 Tax=Streptomyces sp. ISL-43 TaxID=2819183 RepID=UPI001BEA79CE|nr:heme ABC exporter ATP-binding protein CcmA [Streptomyces sp. ISL-43]MBT2445602.1 heme ABC exporter ATP-binding protein CcmA [Streptomyces sp. ISL-43]
MSDVQSPALSGPADAVVDVRELCKRYGTKDAVDGVSFQVRPGEVFGLLGPNGAGKTTTLECLVGLRKPTAGTIRILGMDPAERTEEFRQSVAVQPQEGALFPNLTVHETVQLWASFYPDPAVVDAVLADVGLAEEAYRRVQALSGGQRRRLLLAVTVVGRPDVLVLDEPAAGLDPQSRKNLWAVVRAHRERGGTVLLTTHDMTEATELCDRVAVIVGGRIAACDTPAALVAQLADTSTVTFTADGSASLESVRLLSSTAAVEAAPIEGGRVAVRVRTRDADETLRSIAADQELQVRGLDVVRGGLEEVFETLATGAGTRAADVIRTPEGS